MENQWTELTCRVAVEDLDEMAAIAQMVVGAGLYIEDYSDLEEKTLEGPRSRAGSPLPAA